MRTLGLDYGDKRIGVAISDPDDKYAMPLTVIKQDSETETIASIFKLIEQYQIGRVVVGLPRHLNGKLGRQADKVKTFVTRLTADAGVLVDTWDEWLSTVAADRLLGETGMDNRERKGYRDATAAAFILQGYLDSRQHTTDNEAKKLES